MSWTEERIDVLRKLWVEGLSASQIAVTLGSDVTRNAVIGKIHRMGLASRILPAGAQRLRVVATQDASVAVAQQGSNVIVIEAAAPPAPRPVAEVVARCERVTLMDLRESTCRWPLGDPAGQEFRFCGARSSAGVPYCDAHRRLAYQPVNDRRRDRTEVRRSA